MPETSLGNVVQPHYLDRVMRLAACREVTATEDILDQQGAHLLKRGARLGPDLHDLLAGATLRRPLEMCLMVEDAVDAKLFVRSATRMLDTNPLLARILRSGYGAGPTVLSLIGQVEFGKAIGLMLTASLLDGDQAIDHCVTVSLLAVCMSKQLRLTEDDQLVGALAGLLHDIGIVYVDPACLAPGRHLSPHQWLALTAHPRIGQDLVNELESYPLAVGRAIGEHHERFDGFGYPRKRSGNHISAPGQALALADMVAAATCKECPTERTELAIRIFPGEHAPDLVSVIASNLRSCGAEAGPGAPRRAGRPIGVDSLFWRISSTLETAQNLVDAPTRKSPQVRDTLEQVLWRVRQLEAAFHQAGLAAFLKDRPPAPAMDLRQRAALREIAWRLCDTGRHLALESAMPDQKSAFAPLINLLEDDPDGAMRG